MLFHINYNESFVLSWTITGISEVIFVYLRLFWSIFVYLGLYWSILIYLMLSRAISGSSWLFLAISVIYSYLWLSQPISGYLGISLTISGYLWLSLAISGFLGLSLAISSYPGLSLELSQASSGYLGHSLADTKANVSIRVGKIFWNFKMLNFSPTPLIFSCAATQYVLLCVCVMSDVCLSSDFRQRACLHTRLCGWVG